MRRAILIPLFVLIGCGGGGGGSGPVFAGTWRGSMVLTQNTCQDPSVNFDAVHTVNENGEAIALRTQNGTDYAGFSNGASGFSVTHQFQDQCVRVSDGQPVPNSFAQTLVTITYEVTEDSAQVTILEDIGNCTQNPANFSSACKITHEGRLTRDES